MSAEWAKNVSWIELVNNGTCWLNLNRSRYDDIDLQQLARAATNSPISVSLNGEHPEMIDANWGMDHIIRRLTRQENANGAILCITNPHVRSRDDLKKIQNMGGEHVILLYDDRNLNWPGQVA